MLRQAGSRKEHLQTTSAGPVADHDVDPIFLHVHPRHVAGTVVVRHEGVRSQLEVALEARILREQGCLHPHPEKVTDEAFVASEFFDRRDLVQVKYEMLRRVRVDGHSVSQSAVGFGLSRPSYYEAQAAYDLSQVSRIVDENNVAVALEQLSVLTGQKHSNLNILKEDFDIKVPEPNDRASWVEFALQNNFALKASEYGEEAARQNAKSKALEHGFTISGSYSYSDDRTDGSLVRTPSTVFDVPPDSQVDGALWALRVDLPLYSGGAISADRRRAAQEFNASRESRINLSRNTVTNTRSLHMTVNSNVSRVAARAQAIVSSKSALDATQAGYEVGTRNVVDVLNAQNTLSTAQRDYANSRYDYILNMMRLKEQSGLLSPEDVIRLDSYLVPPPPPTARHR